MDTKEYPKTELVRIKTSTALICAGCKGAIRIYEECWEQLHPSEYYHNQCRPLEDKPVVKTIMVKESLSVKSQGK